VIVDECHARFDWLVEIMASEEWADVPFIGLSATPWSRGLGNIYDDLLIPATMWNLIEEGYLAPFRVFAPSHPDLSAVKIVGGDYREADLSKIMGDHGLVADVVSTWKEKGEGRPTICFAVDRAHAKKLQARFEEQGVPCGYIDAYTPTEEREKVRARLDGGEIKVVTNVGCLIKGVDWAIGCIILAMPTKSEIKFVQAIGRGLRVNPEIAPDCIVLDHSDNTIRMGFPTDIHRPVLCTAKKGERQKQPRPKLPKECPSCSYLRPKGVRKCPACGFMPDVKSEIEEIDGELRELKPAKDKRNKQLWYSGFLHIQQQRGYSRGWVAHQYREALGVWPRGLSDIPTAPTDEVRNFVTSRLIRHAKRKGLADAS
jgi:superfamily II DNA or RNA helicase